MTLTFQNWRWVTFVSKNVYVQYDQFLRKWILNIWKTVEIGSFIFIQNDLERPWSTTLVRRNICYRRFGDMSFQGRTNIHNGDYICSLDFFRSAWTYLKAKARIQTFKSYLWRDLTNSKVKVTCLTFLVPTERLCHKEYSYEISMILVLTIQKLCPKLIYLKSRPHKLISRIIRNTHMSKS
jgi:hypothetical protein